MSETNFSGRIEISCPDCGKKIEYYIGMRSCPTCKTQFESRDVRTFNELARKAAETIEKSVPVNEEVIEVQENFNEVDLDAAVMGADVESVVPTEVVPPIIECDNENIYTEPVVQVVSPDPLIKNKIINPVKFNNRRKRVVVSSQGTNSQNTANQKENVNVIFSHNGKFFYSGQEAEACIYILQYELIDCVFDEYDRITPALENISSNMCNSSYFLPENEKYNRENKFYYLMCCCLLVKLLQNKVSIVPLYFKGELISQTPNELLRKIRTGKINSQKLKLLAEVGALGSYLLLSEDLATEEGLIRELCNDCTDGYYHVSSGFSVTKIAQGYSDLLDCNDYLRKYDVIKAIAMQPCSGFYFSQEDPSFYKSYKAELVKSGSVSADDHNKLFYLLSVMFKRKNMIKIFDERFSEDNFLSEIEMLIRNSVKQSNTKRFVLLRALLKFKVFGSFVNDLTLVNIITSGDDPKIALKNAYYYLSNKGDVKRIYFDNEFVDLLGIAKIVSARENAKSVLENGDLKEGLNAVYGKDVSAIITNSSLKISEALDGCKKEFE